MVVPGDVRLLQPGDVEKGGPDWSAARSQLPPKWVDVVDKVCILEDRYSCCFRVLSLFTIWVGRKER